MKYRNAAIFGILAGLLIVLGLMQCELARGETWNDGCNTCTGDPNGIHNCTTLACIDGPNQTVPGPDLEWSFDSESPEPVFIIAADPIKTKEEVEWTTISRTSPMCNMRGCLVIHHDTCNQIGKKVSVTYLEIMWKGKLRQFELEREPIEKDEVLEQSVVCEDDTLDFQGWGFQNN
jgi:hypothetical protein